MSEDMILKGPQAIVRLCTKVYVSYFPELWYASERGDTVNSSVPHHIAIYPNLNQALLIQGEKHKSIIWYVKLYTFMHTQSGMTRFCQHAAHFYEFSRVTRRDNW